MFTDEENAFVEGSEFAPPPSAVAPRDDTDETELFPEDDTSYKELQEMARSYGIAANQSRGALEQAIAEADRKNAEVRRQAALEDKYGPFIVNLWQGQYPNFGCPAEGCSYLTLGTDREDGERQIAEHFTGAHVAAGPASVQSELVGPDGMPLTSPQG